LQKAKEMNKISDFGPELFKAESRKLLSKEIKHSYDPILLNDIVNVEVSMYSDAPSYEAGEDY